MIIVTTSRRPTRRIRSFCNDLSRCLPGSVRINRGKLGLEGLAEKAIELGADRVIVVDRWKGGPGKIKLFHVADKLISFPPLIYVCGMKLQREMGIPKARPSRSLAIVVNSPEDDAEAWKLGNALSSFLRLPKALKDVDIDECQLLMQISRDASNRIGITFVEPKSEVEVGPRVVLSHLIWRLGKGDEEKGNCALKAPL